MDSRVDSFEIAGRQVGTAAPLFVMAEIGLNHDGSLDRALTLVDEAARAGAQAIKLQSLYADRLVAASCPPPLHVDVSSLRDLFARYELDEAAHAAIAQRARRLGLGFISTPFALDAVDMLHRLGVDAYKIASGDCHASPADRTRGEDRQAAHHLDRHEHDARGAPTRWPARAKRARVTSRCCTACRRIRRPTISRISARSARSPTPSACPWVCPITARRARRRETLPIAVALGASIYERHLKPENGDACLDEAVSSNSTELAAAIAAAARAKRAIGHGRREPQAAEIGNRTPSRRALYAVRDLAPGDIVKAEDIIALRPGDGLSAVHYAALAGTTVSRAIAAGEAFVDADLPFGRSGEIRGAA